MFEVSIRNRIAVKAASKLDEDSCMRTAAFLLETFSTPVFFFDVPFAMEVAQKLRDQDYEQNDHWTTFTIGGV